MTSNKIANKLVNKKGVNKQRIGANMEICPPRKNRKIIRGNNLCHSMDVGAIWIAMIFELQGRVFHS